MATDRSGIPEAAGRRLSLVKAENNLEAWKALVLVHRTGSLTRAAGMMSKDIPSVSRLIKALEGRFGKLVDSKSRPVRLTDRGLRIIERAIPVLEGFEDVFAMSSEAETGGETIRISVPSALGKVFLARHLAEYQQANPAVHFEINSRPTLEALLSGAADIGFLHRPHPNRNLTVIPCPPGFSYPLASPEYLNKQGIPHSPQELSNHHGILQTGENFPVTRLLYSTGSQPVPISWKSSVSSDDQLMIKELALNGGGIAVDLMPTICRRELEEGSLLPILEGWHRRLWDVCIAVSRDREQESPELRKFVQSWARKYNETTALRISDGDIAIKKAYRTFDSFMHHIQK